MTRDGLRAILAAVGRQPSGSRGGIRGRDIVLLGSLLLWLGLSARAEAARTTLNLARVGDTAPETRGGTFSAFGPFSLADPGIVAFQASINPSPAQPNTTQGLFLSRKDERGIRTLSRMVLKGDTAQRAGSFYSFDTLSVNVNQKTNKVQVAFWASLLLRDDVTLYEGLYLYTEGAAIRIALTGDLAPAIDPPTTFGAFFGTPILNDQGQVAFWASLSDGSEGIFVYDPSAGLKLVTRKPNATPTGATGSGGSGTFQQLATPSLNPAGQVAFLGFYSAGGLSSHGLFLYSLDSSGTYDSTGSTNAVTVATSGMVPPPNWGGGGTQLNFVDRPSLNSLAHIAFWGRDNQGTPRTGLILHDGSSPTTLASSGTTSVNSFGASGGAGTLTEVDNNPALNNVAGPSLNDAGVVVFWGKSSSTTGLVLYQAGPLFSPIAASGMGNTGIADGAGTRKFGNSFTFISSHASLPAMVNPSKAVAFWATTLDSQGAGSSLVGLFLSEESAPDLMIEKVIASRRVRRNTNLTVTARVKNQGSAGGPPETVEAKFIKSDGTTSWGTPGSASSTAPLEVGKARNVRVRLRAPDPTSGDCPCWVKVTVDSGGTIAETNESNNSKMVGISIR